MKNYAKTLSIGIVLVLALGFYLQKQSPLVKNEVETPQVEFLATSSAESLFALPPIGAVGVNGPQDCFDRGTFVDFMSLPSVMQVPADHEVRWRSTPSLPGLNTSSGINILNTYYIPSWITPGCYLVTAEEFDENDDFVDDSSVMIRIKFSPSDPCEVCDIPPGGGGSGGPSGGGGPGIEDPTSTGGGGDGAA